MSMVDMLTYEYGVALDDGGFDDTRRVKPLLAQQKKGHRKQVEWMLGFCIC